MVNQRVFEVRPIGYAHGIDGGVRLDIIEEFRPGLKLLREFSHVLVFWWAERQDNDIKRSIVQAQPPHAPSIVAGVFACRTEFRPNPLVMALCPMITVDEERGVIDVSDLSIDDGAPLVDLKAYIPDHDAVPDARIPDWMPCRGNGAKMPAD